MDNLMKKAYAYSIVFRNPDKALRHLLGHCYATNSQEARGWAHEQFEEEYPDCKLASLLIREIAPHSETRPHEYITPRIQPEFTLPNKL